MLEEKKTLEDQLEEAERRRAEAERGRAEGRSEENKICLLGDSFCLNVPSFGGVSTGIFLLGVVLGLVCGCRCDTSRLCSIFNCCCPASARAGSDDIIIVFFCYSNCNYYFYYNHNFFFNCCCPASARAGSDGLGTDDINININVDDDDDSEKQYLKSGSTEV